jgi:hypothetical protein
MGYSNLSGLDDISNKIRCQHTLCDCSLTLQQQHGGNRHPAGGVVLL